MKKILYFIFVTILTITLLINIFSMLNLSFFGYRLYKVGSGSMEPYLKVNNYILVKEVKDYKVNDVITYKSDNSFVTHRIVKIKKDKITTKGDANNKEDEPISKDKVIGKVTVRFVILGFILSLFSNPIIWVLILLFGVVITMIIPNKKRR